MCTSNSLSYNYLHCMVWPHQVHVKSRQLHTHFQPGGKQITSGIQEQLPVGRGSHTGQYHLHLMEEQVTSHPADPDVSDVLSAVKPPHLLPAVLASCSHLPPLPLLHCPAAVFAAAWCHVEPLQHTLMQDALTASTSFKVVLSRLFLLWLSTSILGQSLSPIIEY